MNSNTFAGFVGGTGRNQLLSQSLSAVTETEIRIATDNAAGAIAVLTIPTGTAIAGSASPLDYSDNAALINRTGRTYGRPWASGQPAHNSKSFDSGRPFLIRFAGVVTPASNASNSLNFILYNGTTKGGTSLAATGALTGTETSVQAGSFILEAQLQWDSVSGLLGGSYWYQVLAGATASYNTWKATSLVSGVTLATLNFCVSTTWGNSAGGVVVPSEMSISQL